MKKILFALLLSLFIPAFTLAASNVSVVGPNPIFNETNLAPGDTITKTITVTNNSSTNEQFKFQATSTTPVGILADKINIRVVNTDTSIEKYNNSLASLYSDGEINLDVLAPATPVQYNFIATFDENAGNDYMGLSEKFDLTIGFAATPSTNPATDGGVSTPANPLTAFAGFLGFTSTTVTTTDTPSVAGAETAAQTPEVKGNENGNVRGSSDKVCPWWWIVGLVLILLLAFIGGIIRAVKPDNIIRKYYYIWPIALGLVAWVAHYFLHKGYQETWFCQWYWLLIILIIGLAEIAYYFLQQKNGSRQS
ncbi:MAG: hypothetical protein WC437_03310 [Patescibacteria group bacterium]